MFKQCITIWMIAVLANASTINIFEKDDFLSEIKDSCLHGSSLLSCSGYYAISTLTRYLHDPHPPIQKGNVNTPTSSIVIQAGPAALVRLEKRDENITTKTQSILEDYFRGTFRSNGSTFDKTIKFISQLVTDWMEDHAVTIIIPSSSNGPRIILQDGDKIRESQELENVLESKGRSHGKKKWAYMIPLMAFTKFLMLKALLIPIFVAVMIIKKIALLGLFYLPPWFASLRICKKDPVVHYHHKSAYDHDEYAAAAAEYDGAGYQYTSYGDWSRHHRRSYHP